METFSLCYYTVGPAGNVSHRTWKARFGDGYEQAAGNGINPKQSVWDLTFDGTASEMAEVTDFLDARGEWERFQWTDPLGNEAVFRAGPYAVTPHGGDHVTVSVQFRQVGAV